MDGKQLSNELVEICEDMLDKIAACEEEYTTADLAKALEFVTTNWLKVKVIENDVIKHSLRMPT